jgi:enoyl-CoA hydratase/carnithine racemase
MDIVTSKADGILTIEFNRPEKKNVITAAMYTMMADALNDADKDPSVRTILITGTAQAFTAGNDLEDFLKNPPQEKNSPVTNFMMALHRSSKPVVASVCGVAVGIGTTMLMHCDLVYAGDNAKFSMPFAPLGLCPEFGSSMLLPRLAGYQRAAEKLLLGEPFSAEEAREMGLVSKVLKADEVLNHARIQAAKLVALPASSIRITKRLMKAEQAASIDDRMDQETRHFGEMLTAPEAKEAFSAFLQKRKPDFTKFS